MSSQEPKLRRCYAAPSRSVVFKAEGNQRQDSFRVVDALRPSYNEYLLHLQELWRTRREMTVPHNMIHNGYIDGMNSIIQL